MKKLISVLMLLALMLVHRISMDRLTKRSIFCPSGGFSGKFENVR